MATYEAQTWAARARNQAHEAMCKAIDGRTVVGMTEATLRRLLSGPANPTLDTISALLFAVGCTFELRVIDIETGREQP